MIEKFGDMQVGWEIRLENLAIVVFRDLLDSTLISYKIDQLTSISFV